MDKSKFVVVDTNAIIHRAFHAYPPTLETIDGIQVNAVFGFATMLLKVIDDYNPKYLVCAMDTKKPTFRHLQYPEYKATRKPTDQSLIDQFPLVEEVIQAFNIPILKREGFEADDIIGTLASWVDEGRWSTTPLDMVIVTGDRDLLQLATDKIGVALPAARAFSSMKVYTPRGIKERYGYTPEQVVDYKAMVGDASDNIPGVKGIGDKSALTLLSQYGDLENIYKHLTEVKSRWQKLLGEGVEQAEMSKSLATIKRDVELSVELESCLMSDFKRGDVVDIFTDFGFRTLIGKIPNSASEGVSTVAVENGQMGMFGGVLDSVSVEDTFKMPSLSEISSAEVVKLSKGFERCYLFSVGVDESKDGEVFGGVYFVDKLGQDKLYTISDWSFTSKLHCETYTYNLEDVVSRELTSTGAADVALLAHLISSGRVKGGFSGLVFDYLSEVIPEQLYREDLQIYLKLLVRLTDALVKEASALILGEYSKNKVIEALTRLDVAEVVNTTDDSAYINVCKYIETPVSLILKKMEDRGVLFDMDLLGVLKSELIREIDEVKEGIYKEVGHEFNVASPKQVGEVLFDELHLGMGQRKRSTRESILQKMKDMHPVVPLILKFREVSKLLSTYVEPYVEFADGQTTGTIEIHTDYKQLGTTSGRFSSQNPNMQNIPARGAWAGRVRELFKAREGMSYVALDYSQVENRIMADISGDKVLINDFLWDKDIHRATASRIFGKPEKSITSNERTKGKTVNFGILYGQTEYGLASMLDIPRVEAKEMIDNYFENYTGVANYIKDSEERAREKGYVESMFGRRRYVPGLKSKNRRVYEAAVREAINMPIQGGDADVMKLAMILVDRMIQDEYKDSVFAVLQVHDEMIYEVEDGLIDEFAEKAKDIMENVLELKVPLKVHYVVGKNLAELKE